VPAYPALVILLAGYLFANTFYWNRTALLALGRPDFPMKVNVIAAVLKLAGILCCCAALWLPGQRGAAGRLLSLASIFRSSKTRSIIPSASRKLKPAAGAAPWGGRPER
jgi:O-antigen/teichoic acid export membrane protein